MGIGDWGLGIGPNPQSPIPNPQSPIPIPNPQLINNNFKQYYYKIDYFKYLLNYKIKGFIQYKFKYFK